MHTPRRPGPSETPADPPDDDSVSAKSVPDNARPAGSMPNETVADDSPTGVGQSPDESSTGDRSSETTPIETPPPGPGDTAATFCATLVDEWVHRGLTDAVLSPGSRSTPMALALATDSRVTLHVHHDERSASFMALGHSLASRNPTVVLCTSGTAATELHAAVVEAHQAHVPLLVLTADRPPELQNVGAPQT
ncbi:MAG: thiamine pyrophosphate-binding protein, partial [Microthrixaceae bacterium]